jgi:hypothetical protein
MKSTRPSKNGLVPFRKLAIDFDELESDYPQATLFVAAEDPTDQLSLDAVGLDEDEGAFGHFTNTAAVDWIRRGV